MAQWSIGYRNLSRLSRHRFLLKGLPPIRMVTETKARRGQSSGTSTHNSSNPLKRLSSHFQTVCDSEESSNSPDEKIIVVENPCFHPSMRNEPIERKRELWSRNLISMLKDERVVPENTKIILSPENAPKEPYRLAANVVRLIEQEPYLYVCKAKKPRLSTAPRESWSETLKACTDSLKSRQNLVESLGLGDPTVKPTEPLRFSGALHRTSEPWNETDSNSTLGSHFSPEHHSDSFGSSSGGYQSADSPDRSKPSISCRDQLNFSYFFKNHRSSTEISGSKFLKAPLTLGNPVKESDSQTRARKDSGDVSMCWSDVGDSEESNDSTTGDSFRWTSSLFHPSTFSQVRRYSTKANGLPEESTRPQGEWK